MVITLINPSPSRGKRFKINSTKGKRMAKRRLSEAQKLSRSLKASSKKSSTSAKRSLTMWARYPWGIAPKKGKKRMARKARKSARKARRSVPLFVKGTHKVRRGGHRPLVIWTGKRWRRPLKSRTFKRPTRINPRKSYKRYRRNPILPKLPYGIDKTLMTALPVAGGLALGMFAIPQIAKYLPVELKKHGKFFGLAHVVLGVAAMIVVKKDVVKTLGGTLVAMGLYDLLACNVPQLNLPALPGRTAENGTFSADEIVGASFESVGTDFTPAGALGSSYGSSYEGDDIDYGGDSIEIG